MITYIPHILSHNAAIEVGIVWGAFSFALNVLTRIWKAFGQKINRVAVYSWVILRHLNAPIKAYQNQREIYRQKDNPLEVRFEASTMQMHRMRGWMLHVNNHSPKTAYIRTIHVLTSAKKEIPWDIDGYYYRRRGAALPAIQNDRNDRHIALLPDIPFILAIITETSSQSEACEWFMALVIFEDGKEVTTEKTPLIRFPNS